VAITSAQPTSLDPGLAQTKRETPPRSTYLLSILWMVKYRASDARGPWPTTFSPKIFFAFIPTVLNVENKSFNYVFATDGGMAREV